MSREKEIKLEINRKCGYQPSQIDRNVIVLFQPSLMGFVATVLILTIFSFLFRCLSIENARGAPAMGSPAVHTEPAARDVLARAGISKRNKQLQVNSDPLSFTC